MSFNVRGSVIQKKFCLRNHDFLGRDQSRVLLQVAHEVFVSLVNAKKIFPCILKHAIYVISYVITTIEIVEVL